MRTLLIAFACVFAVSTVNAKLLVTVVSPKTTGQKTVIKLKMKNTFPEKIESARAQVFLHNDAGQVVGQSSQWVIGGTKEKPALLPDGVTTFNFVISSDKPFTKTKVIFSRVVLEGGKIAGPKEVEITEP